MRRYCWAAAWLAVWAAPALAHVDAGQSTGFLSGLLHPISGLDHVLAMVTVGLWGAPLGAPAIWLLPGVEVGIAASAILLGTAVMTERRFPLYAAAALIGFFAIFHGHADGTELPPGESGLLYCLGFVVATGCLHAIGIAIGAIHRWPAGRIALRVAGGGVGFARILFLWRAIG
jgi:urease accessory protein